VAASLIEQAVKRFGVDAVMAALGDEALDRLRYEWPAWARPEQLPPAGTWSTWLLLAGRGFGKSRTAAEWVRMKARTMPGSHGAVIGSTAGDVRDVMVKAILACTPPLRDGSPGCIYESSKRSLCWPEYGSTATTYSAEEPDRLRGPNHHWASADEVAAWAYAEECWDMLQMTLRLGDLPQCVVSTTPRAIPLIRRLIADPTSVITRGSTFDNAQNLSPAFIDAVKRQYEGTRLGRQELYAEVLDDFPGALWTQGGIDADRIAVAPAMSRIVIAVDPSGGDGQGNDAQGIVACGKGRFDGHGYVLADRTCKLTPAGWGKAAVELYQELKADRIVYEVNYGGAMVAATIQQAAKDLGVRVAMAPVVSSRGKVVRAEPVSALYEQHRVHHVGACKCDTRAIPRVHKGCLSDLEDEMCRFTSAGVEGESPNRADALVFALAELMLTPAAARFDPIAGVSAARRI